MEKILSPIVHWIIHVIHHGGYPGIVILMAIESACIPLPSEVIMPFSGALAGAALAASQVPPMEPFNLHLVAWAGALGCAVGSAAAYWVGARGGRPFIERYGRYVLIRHSDLDRADQWFERWGAWAVFIARLLPVVRTFISLPAGIARMRFGPFILLSFAGSLPWCYLLAYVGMVLGDRWESIKTWFRGADVVIGIAILALAGVWLWHHLKPEDDDTRRPEPESE